MSGNREYKSDVFSMLMEDKANALQVYNAVNGTAYDDPELVQICTLNRGVSLSVRNDASFFLGANLSIYEHQSSVCPNMPIRCLIYVTSMLEEILRGRNIYGHYRISLPIPKFAIFYNGEENQPDQFDMKLSDSFKNPVDNPELELTCRVYNINYGHNSELLGRCPVLRDYMTFIDYVREYHRQEGYENLETAINCAIDRCIDENVLKDFLKVHRSEVVKVTQLDYTFDRQIVLEREEAIREGRREGIEKGLKEGIEKGLKEGREEGREEGISQARIDAVKNMISLGLSKKSILTRYTLEEYEKAVK